MPYKPKASHAKRKKLVAWVKEQLESKEFYEFAKELGVNTGNLNWVASKNGFSQEVWDASGLEDPPPRERFTCQDPGRFITYYIDELCSIHHKSRTEMMIDLIRFWYIMKLNRTPSIDDEQGESNE